MRGDEYRTLTDQVITETTEHTWSDPIAADAWQKIKDYRMANIVAANQAKAYYGNGSQLHGFFAAQDDRYFNATEVTIFFGAPLHAPTRSPDEAPLYGYGQAPYEEMARQLRQRQQPPKKINLVYTNSIIGAVPPKNYAELAQAFRQNLSDFRNTLFEEHPVTYPAPAQVVTRNPTVGRPQNPQKKGGFFSGLFPGRRPPTQRR